MNLYQMDVSVFDTLLEDQDQSVFRNFNWFAVFLSDVGIRNSINENARFCVNIHFVIWYAVAKNQCQTRNMFA